MERLGNRLAEIESMVDWGAFRPIVSDMYDNKSEQGGRPNIDEVVMIKLLVLQQWYGLSDPELERQAADRLSFIKFLGFPADIPDFTTVWKFREQSGWRRPVKTRQYGRNSNDSLMLGVWE